MRFLEADKIEDAFADVLRNFVGLHERSHLVETVVFDNGDDFGYVDMNAIFTGAVTGRIDRERFRMGREFRQGVVVHADAAVAQAGIQLQNNLRGHFEIADGVAARRRKVDAAIGQNCAHLDDGDSRRRDGARAHEVAHLAEMRIDVIDAPVVNSLAQTRIALVGHAELHRLGSGQGAVATVASRGSRKKRNLEILPFGMQAFGTGGNRRRNRLRVPGQRKAGNTQNITIVNHLGRGRGTALLTSNPVHDVNIITIFPA